MRQNVLTELGALLHQQNGHAQLLDPDQPFNTTERLVLSDHTATALAQLRAILPGAHTPGRRIRLGVCWAGPDSRHEKAK
ncbi:hypothetical protein [Streptomyces longisporoflavus]|uniref:Uncharacterized protein n=1 Tax=Streptomyces longisporoflavus TaxID=28044 RepID=A0ABW7R4S6_9ACTN